MIDFPVNLFLSCNCCYDNGCGWWQVPFLFLTYYKFLNEIPIADAMF